MFKVLERSHDNIIGVEVGGDITLDDIKLGEAAFEELIEKYGKVSWLCIWTNTHYTTMRAFYEDAMWMLKHLKNFDRMAVVSDKWWKKLLIKTDGMVFGEKYFDVEDLEKAWAYVEGEDA